MVRFEKCPCGEEADLECVYQWLHSTCICRILLVRGKWIRVTHALQ